MITVTEDVRDLFREVDNPDGTVLRLDPVTAEGVTARRDPGEPGHRRAQKQRPGGAARRGRPAAHCPSPQRGPQRERHRPGEDTRRTGPGYQAARPRTITVGRVLRSRSQQML